MKYINCNVSGNPGSDAPVIFDDYGHHFLGTFSSDKTRITFALDDNIVGGGHLKWNSSQVDFLLPLQGSNEGSDLGIPTLEYKPKISPIHIEGNQFKDGQGNRFVWKMNTDFMLLKRYIDGEDITSLLEERANLGSNGVRVLGMAFNLFKLNPELVNGYYQYLKGFVQLAAGLGLYVEYVAFADKQYITLNRFTHWSNVINTLSGEPNIFVELANEFQKNGIDPYEYDKPANLICSQGSNMGDGTWPAKPGWDYHTWHGRRDYKAIFSSCEDLYNFANGKWAGYKFIPAVQNEPVKFGDGFETNPYVAYAIGVTSSLYGNGCTFHCVSGLLSNHFSDSEKQLAIQMYRGLSYELA